MPRPYRPNPCPKGTRGATRAKTHVKQETAAERKARLRAEAEVRQAEHAEWCAKRRKAAK